MIQATQNTLLQAALEYAGLGYPVFPLVPGDSKPLTKHGCLDATTDENQIVEWWEQRPFSNIGIATEGLVVVDIDGESNEWLSDADIMQSLTGTAASKTPRGGRHFVFRQPSEGEFRNTTSRIAPKVDTRADGGYIVAPPSIREDGAYQWLETYKLDEPKESLPVLPGWIVEKLNEATETRVDLGGKGNPIKHGTQHDTLFRFGCLMRNYGSSYDEINAALQVMNRERCEKPGTVRAIEKIAENAAKYEPDQITTGYIEGAGEQFLQNQTKSYTPFPVDQLPESISDFVLAGSESIGCDTAYIILPLLAAFGATIGTTREVFITNTWKVKPILWTAVIGESGTAKTPAFNLALQAVIGRQTEAHQGNREAIERYDLENMAYEAELKQWQKQLKKSEFIPPDEPIKPAPPNRLTFCVSDVTVEALAPLFSENPRGFLLHRDEIAGWIGDFDKYNSGGGGSDEQHFLSMYNASAIQVHRKGTRNDIFVPQAALSITGGIQPGILKRSMSDKQKQSGFLARFLLAYPERKVKQFPSSDISMALIEDMHSLVAKIGELQPVSNEGGVLVPVVISLSTRARDAFMAFYEENARETVHLHNEYSAAWSKLEEIPVRLALIFHCTENATAFNESPEISLSTMKSAIKVTQWFKHEVMRIYPLFQPDAQKSKRELTTEKHLAWIEKKGGVVTVRQIQQGHRKLKSAEEAEEELKHLASEGYGKIVRIPPPKSGGHEKLEFHLSTTSTSTLASETSVL